VLVAIWIDQAAHDEAALRGAARTAVRKAIGVCVEGREPDATRALVDARDTLTSPFYTG
jgi:hypothetical protein